MGLTPAEFDAWHDLVNTDEMRAFDDEMDKVIRLDDIVNERLEDPSSDDGDEEEPEHMCIEVFVPMDQAEPAYAAWWSYLAGNTNEWANLELLFTEMFDALGWALYGPEELDDDDE